VEPSSSIKAYVTETIRGHKRHIMIKGLLGKGNLDPNLWNPETL
jgi:hypothetical protein